MPKPKAYISGPMSGYPHENYPVFKEAAHRYRTMGYDVLCPVEMDDKADSPHTEDNWWFFLRRDLDAIWRWKPDFIVILPGGDKSTGALMERLMVERRVGGKVILDKHDEDSQDGKQ